MILSRAEYDRLKHMNRWDDETMKAHGIFRAEEIQVPTCPPMVEPVPWGEPTTHLCGLRAGHPGRHRCSATASCGVTWGESADRGAPASADEIRRRPYPVPPGSVPPTHPAASASALEAAEVMSESEEFD